MCLLFVVACAIPPEVIRVLEFVSQNFAGRDALPLA